MVIPSVFDRVWLPQLIDFCNRQISKRLRFGYDVGKDYAFGEEEVHNVIDYLVDYLADHD